MKQLNNLETAAFSQQMATVLGAGISAYEGLVLLLEESDMPQEQEILSQMLQALQEGSSLSHAMQITTVFPEYCIAMCHIGEETGTLDQVMQALTVHYEQQDAIARSLRNAIIYPAIMTGMILIVILLLLTQVMPVFQQVFAQLGLTMTGASLGFLMLGNTLRQYGWLLGMILFLMIGLCLMAFTPYGKQRIMKWTYQLSPQKNHFQKEAIYQFTSTMAMTIKSGLSVPQGIALCTPLIKNPHFLKQLHICSAAITQGMGLSEAMIQQHMITGLSARMLSLAEKTGKMDQVLSDIARKYHDEIIEAQTGKIARIEPIVIITLSLMIGGILIAVMLPLLNILSGI